MKKKYSLAILCSLAAGLMHTSRAEDDSDRNLTLRYREPAPVDVSSMPWDEKADRQNNGNAARYDIWESKTLPIGNGRIGATIYGGQPIDCLVLNEISLWTGGKNAPGNGSGYAYGPLSDENQFGSYQPFGQLFVRFNTPGEISDFERSLCLRDATAHVSYSEQRNNTTVRHKRTCFASCPDDVIVYSAEVDTPGMLDADIAILPFHTVNYRKEGKSTVIMSGTLANGEQFEGRILVLVEGGTCNITGKTGKLNVTYQGDGKGQYPVYNAKDAPYLRVAGATRFTVLISLATDYRMDPAARWKGKAPAHHNTKVLASAQKKGLNALLNRHTKDYKNLFDRLTLDLSGGTSDELRKLPTDERLARYRKEQKDTELEALIFQYSRYLLISSSRPGNLPANLQGIWNSMVQPPWACDYHNNINLQMCYWGAEVANLSECHKPLLDFIRIMQEPMAFFTKNEFGNNIRGWTARISQNPWGGVGWTMWNTPVNAWLALHMWEHYQFTADAAYLKKEAYPVLRNVSQFWEDRLKVIGAEGQGLQSDNAPLTAAEHPELREIKSGSLVAPKGWSHEWGPVEDGVAHDRQLIRELFDVTAKACKLTGSDLSWAGTLLRKRDKIVGDRVGSGGYLQEWIVDRPDMVSGHRHTSHLIGVYPGSVITASRTPDIFKAAARSLELRGNSGDNRRSWTWPWRTALYARFHDAEHAHEMVRSLLQYNMLDNLLATHPPMQMDGSLGIAGGICEMLLQSHDGRIELLPALPAAWKDGSVKGLKARGNITVDITWQDGQVTKYTLRSPAPAGPVSVLVNGKMKKVTPKPLSPKTKKPKKTKGGRNVTENA